MKPPEIDVGSRIRAFRQKNGLSLHQLADLTGIAASNLSAIERNKSSPTLRTLVKIARVFHMSAGSFLDQVMHPNATLWKKGEGTTDETPSHGHGVRTLADDLHPGVMVPHIITLEPDSQSFHPGGEDRDRFIHCLEGRVKVSLADEEYELRPGDSLYLLPYSQTGLLNTGTRAAALLMIVSSDSPRG